MESAPDKAGFRMDVVFAVLVSGVILAALYVFLPYSYGYGNNRGTVLGFANWIWQNDEEWQHCYLVPLAIGWILYSDRKRLLSLPMGGHWVGLALVAFSLVVYWAGYRVDNIYIGYGSFQMLTAGLIIWLFGWKWMGALIFPWLFLVFLYPLPFMEEAVTFRLRMIMSNAAVWVLDFIGVDVVRQGTGILSAPDTMLGIPAGQKFSVDVADPCSGIRSLFALMMVSALYGYFTMKSWWKRGVLFACSVPLAILGNLFRILILTFGTIAFGSEFAIGTHALEDPSWFHMAAGYAVFAVAIAGMIGITWLLNNPGKIRENFRNFSSQLRDVSKARPAPRAPQPAAATSAGSARPGRVKDEY